MYLIIVVVIVVKALASTHFYVRIRAVKTDINTLRSISVVGNRQPITATNYTSTTNLYGHSELAFTRHAFQ